MATTELSNPFREEAKVVAGLHPLKSSLQSLSPNLRRSSLRSRHRDHVEVRAPRKACVHTEDAKVGFMCVGRDVLGCELSLDVPQEDGLPLGHKACDSGMPRRLSSILSPLLWEWE